MKLLIVTYGLNTFGGLQEWQYIFAHGLLNKGHDITILEMYDYSKSHPDQKQERNWNPKIKIIHNNGPVVQRGINPNTNWAAVNVIINFRQKIKLHKYISREKFNSILFTDPNFTFYFFKSTLKSNNCFVQFHSSFSRFKSTSRVRYLLTKFRLNTYKRLIFLSKGEMQEAIKNGFNENKVGYINILINKMKFEPYVRKDIEILKQILLVGNLDMPNKQFDHVLKAFALIDKTLTKEWKIKIIGDGNCKKNLEEICENLHIRENVEFVGKKENPAIDFYESSFFVISSGFEGGPITLFECIHTNLPVVAYECSALTKEIIKNGYNGYLIERNNIIKLSEAMRLLIEDPNKIKSMAQNLNDIKNTYSTESILEKWENILFRNKN